MANLGRLEEAHRLGQSVWLDFIQRRLITGGELKRLIGKGLKGMTSNPTIFHKSITESDDYDAAITALLDGSPGADARSVYDRLVIEDIQMAADALRPVYESSGGVDGLVSLEPPARLAYDTEATIAEIRRLWGLVNRPNVMMKVPATPQGIPAVEALIAEGINVNITLMFSMRHYEAVSHAYIRGLSDNPAPEKVVSVASFFVSRVDTYVDRELEKNGTAQALALRGKAAIANSKLVYRRFREVFCGREFASQLKRGARIQRVLWGSTSTKNPAYPPLKYAEALMGPDTVNTMPVETLERFMEQGRVRAELAEGVEEARQVIADLERVGIDLDAITEQLQEDGVKAFVDSMDQLLTAIEAKRRQLVMVQAAAKR